jgi:prevent-host-death family protein
METTITATELSKHLSDVLNRVKYRGESFVIRRNGETVATLLPVKEKPGITAKELVAQIGDLSMPGDGFADDLEAVQAEQGIAELPEWPD